MTQFTHLHNHSEYSLLDGMTRPEEMAEIASTNGQIATAISDHGTMGGFLRFQKACNDQNVKPIFGVEAYFVDDVNAESAEDKRERYHLIILAKNDVGLENLFGINNVAWTEQFYYKPLIDFGTLEKYREGLIVLSGCMGSALSQSIIAGDSDKAEQIAKNFVGLFGEDYYVEIQPHNPPELNAGLIDLADSFNIPLVGTLDCHFPTKQDQGIEEVLLVMGTRPSMGAAADRHANEHFKDGCDTHDLIEKMDILYPERRMSFKDLPLYMMGADEVLEHFQTAGISRTDILENTMEIAEKCNAEIKINQMFLPSFTQDIGVKQTSNEYLEELAFFYLEQKGLNTQEYKDRLQEELEVIIDKNFSDYFLIMWDIVAWADNNGIGRGVARGSAGGCLLSYVLGITDLDPVKHELLFFRFINPERNDFPDIDLDFEARRRDEIKEYTRQRWGTENVAGVAAYGTFKAKGGVKDTAAAFCVPYKEVNKLTSKFDTLEEYKTNATTKEFREKYPEIQDIAERLDGRYKTASAHAAGVVISNVPLSKIAPVEVRTEQNTGRKISVVAYDKEEVGEFGLMKFDFLSVNAIDVIKDTIEAVKERHGVDVTFDCSDVDNPDPRVFEEFTNGNIVGVFQAEGAGYANLIQSMGIHNFSDLVASNALVRPGSFTTQGKTYLDVRDGKKKAKYNHEILKDILEETHGTYIFEEQVMKIAVQLAGFSWGKADRLRKIISKKKDQREFDAYKDDFLDGASQHITRKQAEVLWGQIEKASLYMFNKSHSTGYSIHSYQTMWLKVHYPTEFIWATLFNESKSEKVATYIFEAGRLGIEVLPPDINASGASFTLDGDKVRFGMQNISGCGETAIEEILSKRPYNSFEEFTEKVTKSKVRKNIVENMEKIGFFESLGHSPYDKKKYFGPILNWHVGMNETSPFDSVLTDCAVANDSKDENNLYLIRGVVKDSKRTPRYHRVEIEDLTGVFSSFVSGDKDISKRDYVLAMVGDNTVHHIEDYHEVENGSDSKFARWIRSQINNDDPNPFGFLLDHGISEVNQDKDPYVAYLLSTATFKTKKDTVMGNVYIYIPDAGIEKLTVFPGTLMKRHELLGDPFEWVLIKTSENRNSIILDDVVSVVDWCERREIALPTNVSV